MKLVLGLIGCVLLVILLKVAGESDPAGVGGALMRAVAAVIVVVLVVAVVRWIIHEARS